MGLHNSLNYDTMDADLRMRQRLRQKQGSPVVTGVQQVPLNSAGWPCTRSAGAPAPAGGQKSASVLTLSLASILVESYLIMEHSCTRPI